MSISMSLDVPGFAVKVVRVKNAANLMVIGNDGNSEKGAPITLREESGNLWQQWLISDAPSGDGYYFQNRKVEKVLDNQNSEKSGTGIIQYSINGEAWQRWLIDGTGGGYYYIVNVEHPEFVLACHDNAKPGDRLIQEDRQDDQLRQKWIFDHVN
jgi:hypothetical protein